MNPGPAMRAQSEIRTLVASIDAAGLDPVELSGVYVSCIGYCPFADDPTNTPESIRAILRDCVRELCYSLGVHCADFIPPTWADSSTDNL